ncbi:MAG: alpha/beta fold hydrolase [Microbacterium sp.]|jgi:pimeloyl-ACP methyl ester carboxylesterase|nr:alpha/beta fold hydrolase [Microbacterium sp.]
MTQVERFTIRNGDVEIALTRGGRGRPLVLSPGLLTTQDDLHDLVGLLRRRHHVVTYDLRGHGASSAADDYSFSAFLSDFRAVMATVERLSLDSPVLVGHSLGADLIVRHESRSAVAERLILIDGANPVPEPFITPDELDEFRAMFHAAAQAEPESDAPGHPVLTAEHVLDLNVEIDSVRAGMLDEYRAIDVPIRMIMSTHMAGPGDDQQTLWRNRNWRAGIERLTTADPRIEVSWLDAGHGMMVTHAEEIARIITGE